MDVQRIQDKKEYYTMEKVLHRVLYPRRTAMELKKKKKKKKKLIPSRCYKWVFDVLQIAFTHLLRSRKVLRPGQADRPINYTIDILIQSQIQKRSRIES